MGFKAQDITPLQSPSVTVPVSKPVLVKAFAVSRTDTGGVLKAVLPFGASIIDFTISGTASNAGTTATVSLGSTSAANEYVNGQDVKAAGAFIRPALTAAIPNVEPVPQAGDIPVYAKYAETGTASSAGSWTVVVYFVM